MLIDTDLTGLPVLVLGPPRLTASVVRRYERAGATVTLVGSPGELTSAVCHDVRLAVLVGPAATWTEAREALTGRVPVTAVEPEPRMIATRPTPAVPA